MASTFVWQAGKTGNWTSKGWGKTLPAGSYSAVLPTSAGSSAYKVTVGSSGSVSVDTLAINATNADAGAITLAINGSMTVNTLQYSQNTLARSTINIGPDGDLTVNKAIVNSSGISETIKLRGGTLNLENKNTDISDLDVDFSRKSGGSLNVDYNVANHLTAKITGFTVGDSISIAHMNMSGDTYVYNDDILTILSGGNPVLSLNLQGNQGAFSLAGNSIQGISVEGGVCYAMGTHILTPDGERPIEQLAPGDAVITLCEGQPVPRPVAWLGLRRVELGPDPQPGRMHPVRIKAGAFAANVPHRDLLVSPDHGIFVDGKLICARQLINHMTIVPDVSLRVVTYYHVELDQHAILLAEGLPAESYLNTGNIRFFSNWRTLPRPWSGRMACPTREAGSVIPLHWQEEDVRPIWDVLAARAVELGAERPLLERTIDAQVRIEAKGRIHMPAQADDDRFTFIIPANTAFLRLLSRATAANEAKPWLEDSRPLGLYVKRIMLRDPATQDVWDVPLDHPGLTKGWHDLEHEGCAQRRWTDGDALVPLPGADRPLLLTLQADNGGITYALGPDRRAA